MVTRTALAVNSRQATRILPLGGLLVVSGPPLGGKGPLAARIEETMPNCLKLEAVDNLAVARQSYVPKGPRRKITTEVEHAILRDARRCLQAPSAIPPLVVVCARFRTPALRRNAAEAALALGARFLLVEARSSPIRSLQRITRLVLPPRETVRRIAAYESARRNYEALTSKERAELPALTFKSVLSNLDVTVERLLLAWRSC
jgi:hypothetical protein